MLPVALQRTLASAVDGSFIYFRGTHTEALFLRQRRQQQQPASQRTNGGMLPFGEPDRNENTRETSLLAQSSTHKPTHTRTTALIL